MSLIHKILIETWQVIAEVAPYLLLGFLLAGLFSLLVKRKHVEKVLGKPGIWSVLKATLIGVPMPLCSCGVIPMAASLRNRGASKGATAAFLASTPETGVDSIAATWGLLGPFLAVTRVVLAFFSGILAGLLVQLFTGEKKSDKGQRLAEHLADVSVEEEERFTIKEALRYGFITMPRDLVVSLSLGLIVAGLAASLLPADFLTRIGVHGITAYLLITVTAFPLYICSTGSIPFAYALASAGLSPGAVVVFLVAGPATSAATIATLRSYLGNRAVVGYVTALVITSWSAGLIVDAGFGRDAILSHLHGHEMEPGWFAQTCGVALIGLLGLAAYFRWRAHSGDGCCGDHSACCASEEDRATKHSCCAPEGHPKHPRKGN